MVAGIAKAVLDDHAAAEIMADRVFLGHADAAMQLHRVLRDKARRLADPDLGGREVVVALLGIGVGVFGFAPRLTSLVCWAAVAWAFLIDMLGSAIKVNHWVMDTSLLYHMALAPAISPNWTIAGVYMAIGCLAALLGGWRFISRDLASS